MFERFISDKKKCFYECMIFLIAYMMYVWMKFFLWENAFMKFWNFFFWKCIYNAWFFLECIYNVCLNDFIYEILDFLFLKMHLWMYDFFFWMHIQCMSEWCFLFYEKMHLWNFRLFVFENAFMNAWFFLNAYIIYVWMIFYEKMHLWNIGFFLFENAFMNVWFFWNAYIMYV